MVLMCISVMISDFEHLFICLLTIWISSLGKCLFSTSVHFLNGFLFFNVNLHSSRGEGDN